MVADMAISADTVKRHAGLFGVTPRRELELVLVHGLLHLAGYDDQGPAQIKRMRQREKKYLNSLKIN